jgi:hypothetical protein
MTVDQARQERRRRLLQNLQGRKLEEGYLHPEIRQDLEREAADTDPNALVTQDMLRHLRELTAAKQTQQLSAGRPAVPAFAPTATIPEAFFSTDAVVIVPGYLGSSLSDTAPDGVGLIWIALDLPFHDKLGKLQLGPYDHTEADLDPEVRIQATGSIPILYDLLRLDLEVRRYATYIHAVDWRRDLEMAAQDLVAQLRDLAAANWPIHLVAHSQGALVARRALQILGADEARAAIKHLVLLGPANYGTFAAALAIAGSHSLVPLLKEIAVTPSQGFQTVLASMSGSYQLLPFDPQRVPWLANHDISQPAFWQTGVDTQRLSTFYAWGRSIDTQFFDDRTTVILGDSPGTLGGVEFSGTTLVASADVLAGDGTVPYSCSVLPGARTFKAAGAEHSKLPATRVVIGAVTDILADRDVTSIPAASSDPASYVPSPVTPAAAAFMTRKAAVAQPAGGVGSFGLLQPRTLHPRDARYHDGMLLVKMRQTPPAAIAASIIAAATPVFGAPGLALLAQLERAGMIKRVVPIARQTRGARGTGSVRSTIMALTGPASSPAAVHSADGVHMLELHAGADLARLQNDLAQDPHVEAVSRVPVRYLLARRTIAAAPPAADTMWNLRQIQWRQARALTGFREATNVKVAVLDTGIDTHHPDLQNGPAIQFTYTYDDLPTPVSNQDLVGHGTHVSGTIRADIDNGLGVNGICRCSLSVWKIFTDEATYIPELGMYEYVVEPVMYRKALAACADEHMDVVNLSIGGGGDPDMAKLAYGLAGTHQIPAKSAS